MDYKFLGLAVLIGIIYYSINWICSSLYDNGYDIFKKWNKKKKKRS